LVQEETMLVPIRCRLPLVTLWLSSLLLACQEETGDRRAPPEQTSAETLDAVATSDIFCMKNADAVKLSDATESLRRAWRHYGACMSDDAKADLFAEELVRRADPNDLYTIGFEQYYSSDRLEQASGLKLLQRAAALGHGSAKEAVRNHEQTGDL
jgi:hypothetical protein